MELVTAILFLLIGFTIGIVFAPRSDSRELLKELVMNRTTKSKPVILEEADPDAILAEVSEMIGANREYVEEEV